MTAFAGEQSVLDRGYVQFIESWGSDAGIIESARMSTGKGFLGWGPNCPNAAPGDAADAAEHDLYKVQVEGFGGDYPGVACRKCGLAVEPKPGDEKLLKFLWDKKHATPFEMAGFTIEVKAPIFVFREWHRHRTQSYSEVSARYTPLPDESYLPSIERVMIGANTATTNRQAQGNGKVLSEEDAQHWRAELARAYEQVQAVYARGIEIGVPKELARLPVPVARYSRMRATANLRNWLGFLALRCAPDAQWEIRQYANAVARVVKDAFPRTYDVARERVSGLP